MMDWVLSSYLRRCDFLSKAVKDATCSQWRLLVAQSRVGFSLWNALLGVPPETDSSHEAQHEVANPKATSPGSLEEVATERMKRGFAPPREIYDLKNRGRIDWSTVPAWARPLDPELFEGGHEG
jgi:hypothetical protein